MLKRELPLILPLSVYKNNHILFIVKSYVFVLGSFPRFIENLKLIQKTAVKGEKYKYK